MGDRWNFLGETPDQRKERRRRDLIDAALSLVHEGGLAMLSVRNVTGQDGLSRRDAKLPMLRRPPLSEFGSNRFATHLDYECFLHEDRI